MEDLVLLAACAVLVAAALGAFVVPATSRATALAAADLLVAFASVTAVIADERRLARHRHSATHPSRPDPAITWSVRAHQPGHIRPGTAPEAWSTGGPRRPARSADRRR